MAKLESIEHKIFASEAPLDEIGQFGSALDTTKLNTKDVTTIQALPAYTKGWGSAIISDSNYPTMEEMNGVLNVMSYHTGYLYQEGMPAWRSDREYSATSIVKEPTGTKFFHSLKDGNIGNTLDNTEYWEELKFGGSGLELCDTDIVMRNDKKIFEQLKEMRHSTFDPSKFEVVGSPTITDDGIASGLNTTNYINTGITYADIKNKSWEFANRVYVQHISMSFILFDNSYRTLGSVLYDSGLKFCARFGDSTSSTGEIYVANLGVIPEGWYDISISFDIDTGTYTLYARNLETNIEYQNTYTPSVENKQLYSLNTKSEAITLRISSGESKNSLSCDLKNFSITVDGKEVFSGNKTGLDVIKPDNYEVVSSPVITDDGVASGFSAGYILLPHNFNISNEVIFKLKVSSGTGAPFFGFIDNGGTSLFYLNKTNDTSMQIMIRDSSFTSLYSKVFTVINDDLDIIIKVSNNNLNISINNTTTVNTSIDLTSFLTGLNNLYSLILGRNQSGVNAFTGSIDLNAFKIYVDGNLVYQPCLKIPYTQSKTGSKIVDEVYRDRVIDLYEQTGQAGYYTIDEENQNFTLPMGEIYGMIEQKGTYHPPLLSTMWSDHLLNDMSWLRADTFSWQDGNTYSLAYNELLNEYNNSESVEETEGSIIFKRTPKGYKIALAEQETAIAGKYATDGIAWYYILDTTNKKFKLPRSQYNQYCQSLAVKGNGMSLGLTNGTTNYGLVADNGSYGLGISINRYGSSLPSDGSGWNKQYASYGVTTDPTKSGIIASSKADNDFHLYFYVGEFTKSAEAQTAGLKAELLNGKQDVCIHIIDTYINGTSGYRIWSDGYCEQWGEYGTKITGGSNVDITLMKAYNSTNFNVQITGKMNSTSSVTGYYVITGSALSTNSIRIYNDADTSAGLGAYWKTSGYLAVGQY